MPYLGDFLGQILAEIVLARAHVDLETVRVAEMYAGDELLKRFPIPHLRLPTITVEIPYAVEESEKLPAVGSPRGGVDPAAMRDVVDRLTTKALADHRLRVKANTLESVRKAVAKVVERSTAQWGQVTSLRTLVAALAEAVATGLTKGLTNPSKKDVAMMEAIGEELRQAAYEELLPLRKMPPRLNAIVTTKELLEVKNLEVLSRLRITISEEGQEWTVVDIGGQRVERLIPE